MKPDHDDHLEAGSDLGKPTECSLEKLQRPEIVGEVDNPVLEALRRLRWRGFDRVCGLLVFLRLWIFNRIHGPEPPTAADLEREADHERLVRAFPLAGEAIDPTKDHTGQNRDDSISIAPIRHHPFRFRLSKRPHPGSPHKK
jgi:hypothetical protein